MTLLSCGSGLRNADMVNILDTSWKVWDFLVSKGGLDTRLYDGSLEKDIREYLGLPNRGNLRKLLEKREVPIQDLLTAFFHSIQPYSQMMSDLFAMFEAAGAERTTQNISIDFDFGKDIEGLSFDLNHFRKWMEEWGRVRRAIFLEVWNPNLLWRLVPEQFRNRELPKDDVARTWLEEYSRPEFWPATHIRAPRTGEADFDKMTAKLWGVWSVILTKCKAFSTGPNSLRDTAYSGKNSEALVFENSGRIKDWTVKDLWHFESDHWLGAFLRGVYLLAEEITTSTGEERTKLITNVLSAWREVLDEIGSETADYDDWQRNLKSFLELPIWQKRHELYSVWVCTLILSAYQTSKVKVHHFEGELSFSFAGSHIATIGDEHPFLQLWAELRSPLSNPIGKGRKKAIQPDYSLSFDPSTNPGATAVAIECKQYLKASPRRFSDALIDYAHGRPNARIVLVNYGDVRADIIGGLPDDVRSRCHVVAPLRPDSSQQVQTFQNLVVASGTLKSAVAFSIRQSEATSDHQGLIELNWGAVPSDLDLYLSFESQDGQRSCCTCYRDKGTLTSFPWCQYDDDKQTGIGPETLRIERWMEGRYNIFVHKYSNDCSLANSNAEVSFSCGDFARTFNCPQIGEGRWWNVCKIEVRGSEALLTEASTIEDHDWEYGCPDNSD